MGSGTGLPTVSHAVEDAGSIAPALAAALEKSGARVLALACEALGADAGLLSIPAAGDRETVLRSHGLPLHAGDALAGGPSVALAVERDTESLAVSDLGAEGSFRHGPLHRQYGMHACLAIAVGLPGAGDARAGLQLLSRQVREFTAQEQALVTHFGAMLEQCLADAIELEHLREQEVLYRLSESTAQIGHWTLDLEHELLHWSDEIYRIHGVTPQTYRPALASAIAFYHPDDIPLVTEKLEGVVATGQPDEFRLRIVTPSGELRHVHSSLRARDPSQSPITVVFGTFADISAQVAASRALEIQTEQLQRVFNTVPVRLWIKDAHNRILALNPAAEEFCGMSREEVEGVLVSDLFPASAPSHQAADLSALRDGPRLGRLERFRKADGTRGWVRTDRVPYIDPESGEARILLSSIDVTRETQYEDELQARTQELRRLNKELEEFVYAASHDLRSPLRAIAHLSAWLQEDLGEDLPEQAQDHLRLMRSRVNRLDHLLTDLLAYSRAGRTRARLAEVELEELVRGTFDLLGLPGRFTLETSGLDFRLRTAVTPLEQALRNLMDNAGKHHDRDRGVMRVSAVRRLGLLELTVSDDGPGIPEEHHERIFRAFQTLRSRDEVESSGMGLAILKKLVEYAGGTITLESAPHAGTRGASFRFTWPLHWPAEPDDSP